MDYNLKQQSFQQLAMNTRKFITTKQAYYASSICNSQEKNIVKKRRKMLCICLHRSFSSKCFFQFPFSALDVLEVVSE